MDVERLVHYRADLLGNPNVRLHESRRVALIGDGGLQFTLPELATAITAALHREDDLAIGNIIGSNIFNLGFILGGVAIVRTIKTDKKLIWRDGMVLIAATSTILFFLLTGFFIRDTFH